MALDINKIKAKLNQLQSKNSIKDKLWKPSGKHVIRIVPYIHDGGNPFQEMYFHYGLNGKNYLSPSTFQRPDPIVELADKLKKSGDKEEWKQGASLSPKMRIYVPVIERGHEKEGVKFWSFGKEVYEQILGFIADPDYGDITDPKTGRDITVEFTSAEESKKKNPKTGQGIPETAIRVKPNQTPLVQDGDSTLLEKIKNQPKLTDLYQEPSYDELKEALVKWLDAGSEQAKSESSDTENSSEQSAEKSTTSPSKTSSTEPTKKEEKKAASVSEIENTFDELFNGKG